MEIHDSLIDSTNLNENQKTKDSDLIRTDKYLIFFDDLAYLKEGSFIANLIIDSDNNPKFDIRELINRLDLIKKTI